VIINNRVDVGRNGMQGMTKEPRANAGSSGAATAFAGDFGTPEQEIPPTGLPGVDWETCMTMNDHWGFNAKDANWKSSRDLIRTLCDVASKGGNFLLNVGPRADGTIPEPCLERLREIGRWMDMNGEAIHSTTASPFDELRFGRCTAKFEPRADGRARRRLFFHLFEWPRDGHLRVPTIGNRIVRASLLADPGRELKWAWPGKGLGEILIQLPPAAPDPVCSVVAVEIEGEPIVHRRPAIRAASDEFVRSLQVELAADPPGSGVRYTLDGSDPDAASPEYVRPLELAATTTVKARAFVGGKPMSPIRERRFVKVAPWRCAAPGRQPGLVRQFLRGRFDALPDVADMVADSETVVPAIALDDAAVEGNVVLVFDGVLSVPADEEFEFALTSCDGARLLVDSRLVIDHDGLHAATTRRGFAPLAAGPHRIWLGWFSRRAGEGEAAGNVPRLQLQWAPLGGELAPIPASDLSH
jgi:alpha-L-fucosidase